MEDAILDIVDDIVVIGRASTMKMKHSVKGSGDNETHTLIFDGGQSSGFEFGEDAEGNKQIKIVGEQEWAEFCAFMKMLNKGL